MLNLTGLCSISVRGQASLDRSNMEEEKIFDNERNKDYKEYCSIVHCRSNEYFCENTINNLKILGKYTSNRIFFTKLIFKIYNKFS